jgi:hypothetical protein
MQVEVMVVVLKEVLMVEVMENMVLMQVVKLLELQIQAGVVVLYGVLETAVQEVQV